MQWPLGYICALYVPLVSCIWCQNSLYQHGEGCETYKRAYGQPSRGLSTLLVIQMLCIIANVSAQEFAASKGFNWRLVDQNFLEPLLTTQFLAKATDCSLKKDRINALFDFKDSIKSTIRVLSDSPFFKGFLVGPSCLS